MNSVWSDSSSRSSVIELRIFYKWFHGLPATGLALKVEWTYSPGTGGFTSPLAAQYASISSGYIEPAEKSTFGTTSTCWELDPSGTERSWWDLVEDFLLEDMIFLSRKEKKKREKRGKDREIILYQRERREQRIFFERKFVEMSKYTIWKLTPHTYRQKDSLFIFGFSDIEFCLTYSMCLNHS